jgi:hypothetical protein
MTFLTIKASSLEEAEARARGEARRQEILRLALWRMDSWMTSLIAREAARPWFHYQTFFSAERPYSTIPGDLQLEQVRVDEPLAASPLLLSRPEGARLYFQASGGKLSSPQVADGGLLGLALLADAKPADIERATQDMQALNRELSGTAFGGTLELSSFNKERHTADLDTSRGAESRAPQQVLTQSSSAKNDYEQRSQIANQAQLNTPNLASNRTLRKDAAEDAKSGSSGTEERLAGRTVTLKPRDESGLSFAGNSAVAAPAKKVDAPAPAPASSSAPGAHMYRRVCS